MNYCKSLTLCHSHLSFLGTGASKLTNESVFEETLKRCIQDHPIRLLLLSPDDDTLKKASRRANKDENEFKNIVKGSLRKIAGLRKKYSNIEVRFYQTKPVFRLMFIDNSICLLSYNVFGKGDGSQLPQIIVANASDPRRVESTLYYPLQQYFEDLWASSEEWDFVKYTGAV